MIFGYCIIQLGGLGSAVSPPDPVQYMCSMVEGV